MEIRFEAFLSMFHTPVTHYHAENGALINGSQPEPPDPVVSSLNAADAEIFQQICGATRTKMEQNRNRARDLMNAARLQGIPLDHKKLNALEAERQAAAKTGLQDLMARLSLEGWRTVEGFLKNLGIGMASLPSPAP